MNEPRNSALGHGFIGVVAGKAGVIGVGCAFALSAGVADSGKDCELPAVFPKGDGS
jgi:hypothetical protein